MPITLSYDLKDTVPNQRNYIRSMFERFGWKRLGGSVFRYPDSDQGNVDVEDWLNDIAPSLMFFRSYVLAKKIKVRFFTLDAMSVARVDFSVQSEPVGKRPVSGSRIKLRTPTNPQSSEATIRQFIDAATDAAGD
jgi:hypothetical protein